MNNVICLNYFKIIYFIAYLSLKYFLHLVYTIYTYYFEMFFVFFYGKQIIQSQIIQYCFFYIGFFDASNFKLTVY